MSRPDPVTTAPVSAPGRAKLYFVDYLRAALVVLVILHHTAITSGGSGSFYYTEPATDSTAYCGMLSQRLSLRSISGCLAHLNLPDVAHKTEFIRVCGFG